MIKTGWFVALFLLSAAAPAHAIMAISQFSISTPEPKILFTDRASFKGHFKDGILQMVSDDGRLHARAKIYAIKRGDYAVMEVSGGDATENGLYLIRSLDGGKATSIKLTLKDLTTLEDVDAQMGTANARVRLIDYPGDEEDQELYLGGDEEQLDEPPARVKRPRRVIEEITEETIIIEEEYEEELFVRRHHREPPYFRLYPGPAFRPCRGWCVRPDRPYRIYGPRRHHRR